MLTSKFDQTAQRGDLKGLETAEWSLRYSLHDQDLDSMNDGPRITAVRRNSEDLLDPTQGLSVKSI